MLPTFGNHLGTQWGALNECRFTSGHRCEPALLPIAQTARYRPLEALLMRPRLSR
jgi:hypothetical protein